MTKSFPTQATGPLTAHEAGPARFSKIETLALGLLLGLYGLVALGHAALAPLTSGPDELAHYEYVRFIAEQKRLPQSYPERGQASYKSDQPPLYHLLAAIPAAWVDPTGPPFLKRVGDNPRRQLIERTRHAWGLYNTEDEAWPYRAEVLRWHIGRWVAILLGAATVALTFALARWLNRFELAGRPAGPALIFPLSAAAMIAFTPRFALTGSMLNYETTLALLSLLFLAVLLRLATTSAAGRPQARLLLLLGLFSGLAITAKLSAVILPLEVVVGLWLIKRAYGWPWRLWGQGVLLAGAASLVVVSWWFGFVLYQFNTVASDGWWVGLLRPLLAADASDATTNRLLSWLSGGQAGFTAPLENLDSGPPWAWLAIFFRTFWSVEIEEVLPLGYAGLALALLLTGLAGWGLVRRWRHSEAEPGRAQGAAPRPRLLLSLLLLHLGLPLLLPLLRYAVTFSLADTAQGRHLLFAAGPAGAILLIWGLRSILPHWPRAAALVPALFLLGWSGLQLWTMTWAYLPPLPVRSDPLTLARLKPPPAPVGNDYLTLAGYGSRVEAGVLHLELVWQARAISPVDYLSEISLVDAQGALQAQWLGHPAGGRYPTRAWDVGDFIRDTIELPLPGLKPGPYRLSLDLIGTNLNPPFPGPQHLAEPVALTTFQLSEAHLAAGPQIWQAGQPLAGSALFRYRETVVVSHEPGQTVRLAGPPDGGQRWLPLRQLAHSALFIVGPDWPSGRYQLEAGLNGAEPAPVEGAAFRVIDRWQRQFSEPPVEHRLEANFANRIKLIGYDLAGNRAQPGEALPVTLYWQGLDWLGADYTIFAKLLAADQTVHGGRERLPQEGYRTLYWAPGEIISDPFGVPVETTAPAGVYYLNIGLYEQVGQQAISLPLVQDGQPLAATSLNIGPIKIGQAATGFTRSSANPQYPLAQSFGLDPNLTLLGYDLKAAPQAFELTLYWRSEAPLPLDYTVFVHLRDAAGQTVAQKDQPPLQGAYPTSLWDRGEIIADNLLIPMPAELSAGPYQLVVGLYDFQTGNRLPVPGEPNNEVRLPALTLP
jgi:hypothetical protein